MLVQIFLTELVLGRGASLVEVNYCCNFVVIILTIVVQSNSWQQFLVLAPASATLSVLVFILRCWLMNLDVQVREELSLAVTA